MGNSPMARQGRPTYKKENWADFMKNMNWKDPDRYEKDHWDRSVSVYGEKDAKSMLTFAISWIEKVLSEWAANPRQMTSDLKDFHNNDSAYAENNVDHLLFNLKEASYSTMKMALQGANHHVQAIARKFLLENSAALVEFHRANQTAYNNANQTAYNNANPTEDNQLIF